MVADSMMESRQKDEVRPQCITQVCRGNDNAPCTRQCIDDRSAVIPRLVPPRLEVLGTRNARALKQLTHRVTKGNRLRPCRMNPAGDNSQPNCLSAS